MAGVCYVCDMLIDIRPFARAPGRIRALFRREGRGTLLRYGVPFAHLVAEGEGIEVSARDVRRSMARIVAEIEAGRSVRVTWYGEAGMVLVPVCPLCHGPLSVQGVGAMGCDACNGEENG